MIEVSFLVDEISFSSAETFEQVSLTLSATEFVPSLDTESSLISESEESDE